MKTTILHGFADLPRFNENLIYLTRRLNQGTDTQPYQTLNEAVRALISLGVHDTRDTRRMVGEWIYGRQ